MLGCKDCKNAIFHKQLGEYKCKVAERYVNDPNAQLRCSRWAEGTPGESKEDQKEEE